jgi:hypothetical protein
VTLRAERAVEIVLQGFDAYRDNSVYFSRKVNFDAKDLRMGKDRREIVLSMPLSPQRLVVQIYNAFTGGESGFVVEDIVIDKLPKQQFWVEPQMQRYIDFVSDFVKKVGEYRPGFYPSKNGEFLIQLMPVIRDEYGNELITPARINRGTGRIQLSREAMISLSIPIRVFILMHERKHFSIQF